MRRFHNPRYAPESLERKLSPSGVATIPVAAEIYVPTIETSAAAEVTPIVISSARPAPTTATKAIPTDFAPALSVLSLDGEPDVPSGGTGPAPPDGDGTPPDGTPTNPTGPDNPS